MQNLRNLTVNELEELIANSDNVEAIYFLGLKYVKGIEVVQDMNKAVELFIKAAEKGDASAQCHLGYLYNTGQGGLIKDANKAAELFQRAAQQGFAAGQGALGVMYAKGEGGLIKDKIEAVKQFQLAAVQGHSSSQRNLGVFYENGEGGLTKDEKKAVDWYQQAAAQGHAGARCNLGVMYANGEGGLTKDEKKAAELFQLAANQEYPDAQYHLGIMYAHGQGGLTKDEKKAAELFQLAANQGDPDAQSMLGRMFENGEGGLIKDEKKAAEFYNLAASQGDRIAQSRLDFLSAQRRGKNESYGKEADSPISTSEFKDGWKGILFYAMDAAITNLGSKFAGKNEAGAGKEKKRAQLKILKNEFVALMNNAEKNEESIQNALKKFWKETAAPRDAWYNFNKAAYGNTASATAFKKYIGNCNDEALKTYIKNTLTDSSEENTHRKEIK